MTLDALKEDQVKHAHLPVTNMVQFRHFPKKQLLIFLVLFLLIVSSLLLYIFLNSFTNKRSQSATWQVILNYDALADKLELKQIKLLDKEITQDNVAAEFSPFTLSVLAKDGKKLYSTKVLINTKNDFNVLAYPLEGSTNSANFSKPVQPDTFETLVYVPYINGSNYISFFKDGGEILKIDLPKSNLQVSSVAQVAADCNPLTTVFISDGYSDLNIFHQDVEALKQVFLNVEPFKSKSPSIFDFKTLDNSELFGCVDSFKACAKNSTRIRQIVANTYPNVKKIIVLTNRPLTTQADEGVAGLNTSYVSFLPNASDGLGKSYVSSIAVHEFLGHGVSGLDERYVNKGTSNLSTGPNCSSGSAGKSFWAAAGVTQTYQGCRAENNFAPGPLNCPASGNPTLFSAGTVASAMSAAGCGPAQFDAAERYWIQNYILPKYSACTNPTSTTTPTPTKAEASVCDPFVSDGHIGELTIQDLALVRREVSRIDLTNRGACLTSPAHDKTSVIDLSYLRRKIAKLE